MGHVGAHRIFKSTQDVQYILINMYSYGEKVVRCRLPVPLLKKELEKELASVARSHGSRQNIKPATRAT